MNLRLTLPIIFVFAFPHLVMPVQAQVVPGTGQQIIEVFDDFEDPAWAFNLNLPKSSANIDKVERHPSGFSNNRLYLESLYRGTPDFVRRVETPPGGLPGSTGALAMQTMHSGIPGTTSATFQQDDLIAGVQQKLGYMMPVSWTPSYVVRVYIPPFDKWEQRHGSHFGFRADCNTTIDKPTKMGRFFKSMGSSKKLEQYWPGFFVQLNLKQKSGEKEDYATLLIRSDQNGNDVPGPKITRPGWWTLGLSFTPDGKVHYYAHEGVANLTAKDHLYSNFPYGYRCEQTSTFFFNIVNQDDGHTWSTRWIVDDPKVYVASGTYRPPVQQQMAQKPQAPVQPVPPAQAAAPVKAAAPAQQQTPVAKSAQPITQNPTAIPLLPPPAAPKGTATLPSTTAATPVKPVTPAQPVPMIAAKPLDVPAVTPKVEPKPEAKVESKEEPQPEPKPVTEPELKFELPIPSSLPSPIPDTKPPVVIPETQPEVPAIAPPATPVIEEQPMIEPPPSLESGPAVEKPSEPAPPPVHE